MAKLGERLDQSVKIYARAGASRGGKEAERYRLLYQTSAGVRDESDAEFDENERAQIEHVRRFTMRRRSIPKDGLIVWRGDVYRIRRTDDLDGRSRRIRVTACRVEPRASLAAAQIGEGGEAADGDIWI